MSRLKFNICTSILITLLASSNVFAADQVKTLVIVSDAGVPIEKFSVGDVRKLYLGYPVKLDGQEIHPIINRSDPLLYVVFLQKIVFLSSRSYQRRLKERLFRSGKRGIPEIDDKDELQKRIKESRNTISFMWLESMQNKSLDNTRKIWSGRLPQ
ncbi:MAG TPA: hypothetical protein ENI98_10920 [Gammaproteobacteria bacterium]|nr:hypothetical protein [Gammaproteobacteria bacterium]